MSQFELSPSQRQLITVLVNKYQRSDSPVKSDAIADVLGHQANTVRNRMQSLKDLGLVAGVQGPAGGYRPTERGFAAIGRDSLDEPATVTLSREYEQLSVTVEAIEFPNVFHPDECSATVRFQQSVEGLDAGDPVIVGPTPVGGLVVAGEVEAVTDTADEVRLSVAVMEAPLSEEEA